MRDREQGCDMAVTGVEDVNQQTRNRVRVLTNKKKNDVLIIEEEKGQDDA
jgi:hypothetical protein